MSDFVKVAHMADFDDSHKLCVEINDRFIVLVHIEGHVYCVDDVCTHDGGPLGEGELEGFCLVCPRHGAKFDVRTGDAVAMPATEPTASHEVRIDGDQILVRLCDA